MVIYFNRNLRNPSKVHKLQLPNNSTDQGQTGGTVRAKKLSLKSLALSGLFGAKCSLPKKSFFVKTIKSFEFKIENFLFYKLKTEYFLCFDVK